MVASFRTLAGALTLAAVVCGCAAGASTDAGGRLAADGSELAKLEVEQRFSGDALYVEGSYSYVRVVRDDGREVAEMQLPPGDEPGMPISLEPGRYRLQSWQRPCREYCSAISLGPVRDACVGEFEARRRERLRAAIDVRVGRGCEIEVREQSSASPLEWYTPLSIGGGQRAYQMDTLADVAAHADAVVVGTVVGEQEIPDPEVLARGEGLLGRRITVELERVLWRRPGAPMPPTAFPTAGGSWHYRDGRRTRFAFVGEVGATYMLVLTHSDEPHDRNGYAWVHEGSLALPIVAGRTPALVVSKKPFFDAVAGKTLDELTTVFAKELGG